VGAEGGRSSQLSDRWWCGKAMLARATDDQWIELEETELKRRQMLKEEA
jgi:hypothetical protein